MVGGEQRQLEEMALMYAKQKAIKYIEEMKTKGYILDEKEEIDK